MGTQLKGSKSTAYNAKKKKKNPQSTATGLAPAKTFGNETLSKKKINRPKNQAPKPSRDHSKNTCPVCHKEFRTLGALGSHKLNCGNEPVADVRGGPMAGSSCFSLIPALLADQAECLSDFCHLVIRSLDLYQIQASDLPLPTRGQFEIREGTIGIRCRYCAKKRSMSVASIYFPGNLQLVSTNVYRIADRHLMALCPHIPENLRLQLKELKVETTRQSMTKGRIGLPTYLKAVIDYHNLVPFSNSKGICRDQTTTKSNQSDCKQSEE